jgi:hypothetical protein
VSVDATSPDDATPPRGGGGKTPGRAAIGVGRRLLLALVATGGALLMLAGAYSLVTGRSPRRLFERDPAELRLHFEQERVAAAAANPGEFRVDVDPRVGFTLKTNCELKTMVASYRTDELGLRVRAGPPAAADARTIALVGDSVAFGYGLTGEQCLAQQLEDALAAARDPDGAKRGAARDLVCRSVAVPGWNWRNECAFLGDHLDRIAPSYVLFLPVGNDLSDTDGILETGQRRVAADASAPDPLLLVNLGRTQQNLFSYWPQVEHGRLALEESDLGTLVLGADLGGESSRRFDEMARELGRLLVELQGRGIRSAILQYDDDPFSHALARRMTAPASPARAIPWIPLLDRLTAADTLGVDPHPKAATTTLFAQWIARDLLEQLHWFPDDRAGGRAPAFAPLPAEFAARRAPRRGCDEIAALAAAERDAELARLKSEIVPATGRGVRQVYGGLTPAHGVGPRLLAALPRRRGTLHLELAPLPDRADVGPIELEIALDGRVVSHATLRADGPTVVDLAVDPPPLALADGTPSRELDVGLSASNWVAVAEFGGFELECARLTRLELLGD